RCHLLQRSPEPGGAEQNSNQTREEKPQNNDHSKLHHKVDTADRTSEGVARCLGRWKKRAGPAATMQGEINRFAPESRRGLGYTRGALSKECHRGRYHVVHCSTTTALADTRPARHSPCGNPRLL